MDRRRLLLAVAAVIAALGVAMVFVYARGAESRAADQFDAVDVLVATQKIEPGENVDDALADGKIQLASVTKNQVVDGAGDDSSAYKGGVALTTIYPGEQLLPQKFGGADEVEAAATLPIPKGKIAMSVTLDDPARVGSFTRPGARVSVFVTQEAVSARLLLQDVTVLAAGSATSVPDSSDDGGNADDEAADDEEAALLTIAVTQKEAEKVLFAQSVGTLSFALLNEASEVSPDGGVGPADLFD